jgi:hypothetical protein
MIFISFLLVLTPVLGLILVGMRHERQLMRLQYKAAVERINIRGLR